jgi:dolichol-phosphate mannosyltransferase
MTLMSALDQKARTLRLLARCAVAVPWLVAGWRTVLEGGLRAGVIRTASAFPKRAPRAGDPFLSVILPTFNEAENIAEALDRVEGSLALVPGCSAELIVVDDGSPDGTAARAAEASRGYGNVRIVVREGRRGLASAIVDGMTAARGSLLAVLDADLQHPPESFPTLVRRINEAPADIVVMSRYANSGRIVDSSPCRRLLSGAATLLAHALVPATRSVKDPVSGYFLVRRKALEGMRLEPRGFKILPEILARGRALRTEEVAYVFSPRAKGKSKMRPVELLRYAGLLLSLRRERAH